MKVMFIVPYPTQGASNRYRVEQYLPYLEREGVEYVLRPFWSERAFKILYNRGRYYEKVLYFFAGTFSRLIDILNIHKYDLVFIHRESYPIGNFFENIVALFNKPQIFDFDDAIFIPSASKSNIFMEKLKNPKTVVNSIKRSRHVIAGNTYLAGFASDYNDSVTVIPTSIDTDEFKPHEGDEGDEVVIGWTGSPTTVGFLAILKDVFVELSENFPNIRFRIIGGNYSVDGLSNFESVAWSDGSEKDNLKHFDIGIMPMPDNAWTSGKCGFKAILYMSMGIPCVCSPVGVNKDIVKDGINGFLADKKSEWLEKISILIKDRELRRKMGAEGRRTVEERYSVKINAPKFLNVIKGLANIG